MRKKDKLSFLELLNAAKTVKKNQTQKGRENEMQHEIFAMIFLSAFLLKYIYSLY